MFQSLAEHKTNPNPMNLASNYHGFMGNITLFLEIKYNLEDTTLWNIVLKEC